ncbi:hypothetical protein DFP72DRAFT_1066982 [Ephemerocybe angulata]|uniref:Uncharacterized protein n=1 Tax=Ephemerocybe angulata TaxID=980116 RepID=A0A8H6M640_9AGAR|nr:hypothetical protein DFP72DRAFT_1066982 [Tulosesus angulatus]
MSSYYVFPPPGATVIVESEKERSKSRSRSRSRSHSPAYMIQPSPVYVNPQPVNFYYPTTPIAMASPQPVYQSVWHEPSSRSRSHSRSRSRSRSSSTSDQYSSRTSGYAPPPSPSYHATRTTRTETFTHQGYAPAGSDLLSPTWSLADYERERRSSHGSRSRSRSRERTRSLTPENLGDHDYHNGQGGYNMSYATSSSLSTMGYSNSNGCDYSGHEASSRKRSKSLKGILKQVVRFG